MWGQPDSATLHHQVSQTDGTCLEHPLFLQMSCKSVPVSWVGQEPSPTSSRGFSLEDAQHWLLLGQFSLQDVTSAHLRGINPSFHQLTHVLHHAAPCTLSKQHQLDTKTETALNRPNLDSFLGIFLLLAPAAQRQE